MTSSPETAAVLVHSAGAVRVFTLNRPAALNSFTLATEPFSIYYPAVFSRGPREVAGLTDPWRSAATNGTTLLTRPSFTTMNITVAQQNNTKPFYFTPTSLVLSPPTFNVTSPSYRWEYKISGGAWTSFPSATAPNTNPSAANSVVFAKVTGPASGAQTSLSIRCTATVTAAGGSTVTVKSPIMTKANPAGGQSLTLASFTPDWTTVW